jgi:hypothetical protein
MGGGVRSALRVSNRSLFGRHRGGFAGVPLALCSVEFFSALGFIDSRLRSSLFYLGGRERAVTLHRLITFSPVGFLLCPD